MVVLFSKGSACHLGVLFRFGLCIHFHAWVPGVRLREHPRELKLINLSWTSWTFLSTSVLCCRHFSSAATFSSSGRRCTFPRSFGLFTCRRRMTHLRCPLPSTYQSGALCSQLLGFPLPGLNTQRTKLRQRN